MNFLEDNKAYDLEDIKKFSAILLNKVNGDILKVLSRSALDPKTTRLSDYYIKKSYVVDLFVKHSRKMDIIEDGNTIQKIVLNSGCINTVKMELEKKMKENILKIK